MRYLIIGLLIGLADVNSRPHHQKVSRSARQRREYVEVEVEVIDTRMGSRGKKVLTVARNLIQYSKIHSDKQPRTCLQDISIDYYYPTKHAKFDSCACQETSWRSTMLQAPLLVSCLKWREYLLGWVREIKREKTSAFNNVYLHRRSHMVNIESNIPSTI